MCIFPIFASQTNLGGFVRIGQTDTPYLSTFPLRFLQSECVIRLVPESLW